MARERTPASPSQAEPAPTTEPRSLLDNLRSAEHATALLALADLVGATESAGLVLPSLGMEIPVRGRTDFLVQLGGVPPETAARLAVLLRIGVAVVAAEEAAEPATVTHMWAPAVGDLVHDIAADKVGSFHGLDDAGRWLLRPPAGGEPWPVDPSGVRAADVSDRLRAEAALTTARHRAGRVG
ncbi:hypothetical protein ACFRAR_08275 [Kitasatospora sp. NPDC056651]|uniref:hypothetical protein n=1 Tax=Kitasatospora sp. NPDC056651 TaxID=3345892 RepID=UPI0036CA0153